MTTVMLTLFTLAILAGWIAAIRCIWIHARAVKEHDEAAGRARAYRDAMNKVKRG